MWPLLWRDVNAADFKKIMKQLGRSASDLPSAPFLFR